MVGLGGMADLRDRNVMPRIDRRPLRSFSSATAATGDGSGAGTVGELAAATLMVDMLLPPDVRRELKKGMPDEGVRRGLSRLDRERPGLVATTDGADDWTAVPLLETLAVRCRSALPAAMAEMSNADWALRLASNDDDAVEDATADS